MEQFSEKEYGKLAKTEKDSVQFAFENPKVSIIITPQNDKNSLFDCLSSLNKQTLKEIEIIVIYDDSNNNLSSSIKEFSTNDLRIKPIAQTNQKQGDKKNLGIKNAKGEYIAFVNTKDDIKQDYFKELYNAAKNHNCDIALAKKIKTKKHSKKEQISSFQDKIDISNHFKNPCLTDKIYSKNLLIENNIQFIEDLCCEDELFITKALYFANGLIIANVSHSSKQNSIANKKDKESFLKYCNDKNKIKKDVLSFLIEKNAQIRDKEFWITTNEHKFFNFSWWKKRISLKAKQTTLFNIPIFTSEDNDDFRIQNFLFNLLNTTKTKMETKEEKIYKLFGINFLKRYIENDICKYYLFGILITKFHLADFLYKKYLKKIDFEYDDIYLLHSNSGEIFLFFAYICNAFLEKNNSKKPLFIATKKYHVDILKMYFPQANYIFINNLKFKTQSSKWTKNNHNIYLIFSGNHFSKVELDIKNNKIGTVHYLNNILSTLDLKIEEYKAIKPTISQDTIDSVDKKIEQINLKKDNFIILAPEALTCKELPMAFWNELALELKNLDYDIYLNITNFINLIKNCKYTTLNFQEIFYLAQKAKAIISLRSGLTEFLLPTQTLNISIYTKFKKRNQKKASPTDKTMSGFTLKKIPNISKQNVIEINADNYASLNELKTQIIDFIKQNAK